MAGVEMNVTGDAERQSLMYQISRRYGLSIMLLSEAKGCPVCGRASVQRVRHKEEWVCFGCAGV